MKKIILLLTIIATTTVGFSQSIVLMDTLYNVVSNTTMDINLPASTSNTTQILIKNTNVNAKTLKCRRTILYDEPADLTQFCFGGLCYGYSTPVSSLTLTVTSPDTINFVHNGFHAVMIADGHCLARAVRYVFYDTANVTDSTNVTLHYLCTTGISEFSKSTETVSNVYPSPVLATSTISYKISENTQQAKLVFYDVLGKVVKEVVLTNKEGDVKINSSEFNQGIYFYSLVADDKKIATKKFVVSTK
jgi:hypothetical protein